MGSGFYDVVYFDWLNGVVLNDTLLFDYDQLANSE